MSRRAKTQYGMASLLIITAMVAGYLCGYFRGEEDDNLQTMSQAVYPAADLLMPDRSVRDQLNAIANLVKESIAPDSWIERGGMATLTIYESNSSIVVYQSGATHKQLASLFGSLHQVIDKMKREADLTVSYSLAETVKLDGNQSVEQQLLKICQLAKQTVQPIEIGPSLRLRPDPATLSIVATSKESVHTELSRYLDSLRLAREAISHIDGTTKS